MSRSLTSSTNTLIEGTGSREGLLPEVYDLLDRPEETNMLVLSYSEGPDAWLQQWRTHAGEPPEQVGFVHVGVPTRSSVAASHSADAIAEPTFAEATHAEPLLPDAISDPTDLAQLGICTSEYLESWEGDDRETVVFIDSLTDLLDHVTLDRAFKFLQVLTARVESVDGQGYYLADPSAHDNTALTAMQELMDATVTFEESPPY